MPGPQVTSTPGPAMESQLGTSRRVWEREIVEFAVKGGFETVVPVFPWKIEFPTDSTPSSDFDKILPPRLRLFAKTQLSNLTESRSTKKPIAIEIENDAPL